MRLHFHYKQWPSFKEKGNGYIETSAFDPDYAFIRTNGGNLHIPNFVLAEFLAHSGVELPDLEPEPEKESPIPRLWRFRR